MYLSSNNAVLVVLYQKGFWNYYILIFFPYNRQKLPSYLNAGSTQGLFDFTMDVQRWFLIRHFMDLI